MKQLILLVAPLALLLTSCTKSEKKEKIQTSGNPIAEGWYADPEGAVFGDEYWVYPTFSAEYGKQLHFDAFSSKDLVNWEKQKNILDTTVIKWAKQAMWAPAIIEKDSKFYLFFSANDVQRPSRPGWDENNTIDHSGGIGVAVADSPGGPFKDYLGRNL